MDKNLKLAENLKKFRAQLELTQGDVAKLINKDRSSIAKYESGAAYPPFAVLRRLAKLYDVSMDELCGNAPAPVITLRSDDKPEKVYSTLISKFDKQEQLTILKFKMMDDEKKQDFMRILRELIDD